ncbi:MAG TPA: universal stress protein [Desulfurivibrionaceae bacterium]|nr:universal stress protein [Desulfurivibrionaceae bacterium]
MDHRKLKGRPPYPFETIGVAVAFSPRLEQVLGEARRLAATFGARLVLIHVGERTEAKEGLLWASREKAGLDDPEIPVVWREGDPVARLLETCKDNTVDLLILGARRRENMLRYYLGSVARGLSRAAKCSLLLLTEPRATGSAFTKIVVSGVVNPKTIYTMNTAVYLARELGGKELLVVTESNQPGLAMAVAEDSPAGEAFHLKEQFTSEEAAQTHAMVCLCSPGEIRIIERVIHGRPGYAIRQFAEHEKADLLVLNSPDGRYGLIDRIFTHGMEYILEDLPCNMLIVHSRVS